MTLTYRPDVRWAIDMLAPTSDTLEAVLADAAGEACKTGRAKSEAYIKLRNRIMCIVGDSGEYQDAVRRLSEELGY